MKTIIYSSGPDHSQAGGMLRQPRQESRRALYSFLRARGGTNYAFRGLSTDDVQHESSRHDHPAGPGRRALLAMVRRRVGPRTGIPHYLVEFTALRRKGLSVGGNSFRPCGGRARFLPAFPFMPAASATAPSRPRGGRRPGHLVLTSSLQSSVEAVVVPNDAPLAPRNHDPALCRSSAATCPRSCRRRFAALRCPISSLWNFSWNSRQ